MKELEIKNIPGLGPEDVVSMKKLTYGDKCDLQEQIANIKMDENGKPKATISIANAKLYALAYSITSAPFFTETDKTIIDKVKAIRNLEDETGSFLYAEYEELTKPNLTPAQKKN